MTMDEFAREVEYMRDRQKAYFKDRTKDNLLLAKDAEQRIDRFLKEQIEVLDKEEQDNVAKMPDQGQHLSDTDPQGSLGLGR